MMGCREPVKELLGIPENYFTEISLDVADSQLNLYIDALKGLTPRGREEGRVDEEDQNGGQCFDRLSAMLGGVRVDANGAT